MSRPFDSYCAALFLFRNDDRKDNAQDQSDQYHAYRYRRRDMQIYCAGKHLEAGEYQDDGNAVLDVSEPLLDMLYGEIELSQPKYREYVR